MRPSMKMNFGGESRRPLSLHVQRCGTTTRRAKLVVVFPGCACESRCLLGTKRTRCRSRSVGSRYSFADFFPEGNVGEENGMVFLQVLRIPESWFSVVGVWAGAPGSEAPGPSWDADVWDADVGSQSRGRGPDVSTRTSRTRVLVPAWSSSCRRRARRAGGRRPRSREGRTSLEADCEGGARSRGSHRHRRCRR